MRRLLLAALLLAAAAQSHAYCIYNELRDRAVNVEQERHPNAMRDERKLKAGLRPGEHVCCPFHNLDCNPAGRNNSVVALELRIVGEPEYVCGFPAGREAQVKVTGNGTIRIQPNPRRSANPYIMRMRSQDKDLTGPRGVACTETKSKGKP